MRYRSLTFLVLFAILSLAPAAEPVRNTSTQTTGGTASIATSSLHFPTTPLRRPDGHRWRLGYVGSGDYDEYLDTLRAIVQGLQKLGWLSVPEVPDALDSQQLWQFLATHAKSEYVEFVADAWWQPGQFDTSQRSALRRSLAHRLSVTRDIDLLIAMGTWAGQDIVALGAPVPTIVAAASDPVRTHIIRSAQDSGLDNLHVRIDPGHYERQLRVFHDVVPFRRLGLVHENTQEGKTYSALHAAQDVARSLGFEVVTCTAPWNGISLVQATQHVLQCYQQLTTDTDAVYVTAHRGITRDSIKDIAQILREARIPGFSMLGTAAVHHGILLSLSQADTSYLGMFYANTIAQIFHGARPRQLNQIWPEPTTLVINMETARSIGFDPPVNALLAADEIIDD